MRRAFIFALFLLVVTGAFPFGKVHAKVQCNVNGAIVTRDTIEECQTQNQEKVQATQPSKGSSGSQSGSSSATSGGSTAGSAKNEPTVDKNETKDIKNCDEATVEKLPGVSVTCSKPGIIGGKEGKCTQRYLSCEDLKKPADEAIKTGGTSAGSGNTQDSQSPAQNAFKQVNQATDPNTKSNFNDVQKAYDPSSDSSLKTPQGTTIGNASDPLKDIVNTTGQQAADQTPMQSLGRALSDTFSNPDSWGNAFNNAFESLGANNTFWGGGASVPDTSFNTTPFSYEGFSGANPAYELSPQTFSPQSFSGSTFNSAPSGIADVGLGGYQSFNNISAPSFSSLGLSQVPSQLYNSISPVYGFDAQDGLNSYTLLNQSDPFKTSTDISLSRAINTPNAAYNITDTAFNSIGAASAQFNAGSTLEALANPNGASVIPLTDLTRNAPGALGDLANTIPGVSVSSLAEAQLTRGIPTFADVVKQVQNGNYFEAARLLGQNTASTISDSAARYGSTLREFFRLPGTVFSTAPAPLADLLAQGQNFGFDASGLPTIATKAVGPGSLLETLQTVGDARPSLELAKEKLSQVEAARGGLDALRRQIEGAEDSAKFKIPASTVVDASQLKEALESGQLHGPVQEVGKNEVLARINQEDAALATNERALGGYVENLEKVTASQQVLQTALQDGVAADVLRPVLDSQLGVARQAAAIAQGELYASAQALEQARNAASVSDVPIENDQGLTALAEAQTRFDRAYAASIAAQKQILTTEAMSRYLNEGAYAQDVAALKLKQLTGLTQGTDLPRLREVEQAVYGTYYPQEAVAEQGVSLSRGGMAVESLLGNDTPYNDYAQRQQENIALLTGHYTDVPDNSSIFGKSPFERATAFEQALAQEIKPLSEQGWLQQTVVAWQKDASSILSQDSISAGGYFEAFGKSIAANSLTNFANTYGAPLPQTVFEDARLGYNQLTSTLVSGVQTTLDAATVAQVSALPVKGALGLLRGEASALGLSTGKVTGAFDDLVSGGVLSKPLSFVDDLTISSINGLKPAEILGTQSVTGVADDVVRIVPSGAGTSLVKDVIPVTTINGLVPGELTSTGKTLSYIGGTVDDWANINSSISHGATPGSVPQISASNRGLIGDLQTNAQTQATKTVADYESLVAREAVTARGTLDAKSLSFQRANVEARLADVGLAPTGIGSEVKLLEGGRVPLKVANPGYSIDEILARGYSTAAKTPSISSEATRYMNESFLTDFLATPIKTSPLAPVTTNLSRTVVPLNQFQSLVQSPVGRAIQSVNAMSVGFVPSVDALAAAKPVAAIVRAAPDIAAPALPAGVRITTGADDIARIAARYQSTAGIAQEQTSVAGALRNALANPAPTSVGRVATLAESPVLNALQAGRLAPIEALRAATQVDIPTIKAVDVDSVSVQDVAPITTRSVGVGDIEESLGVGDFKAAENAAQGSVNIDEVRNILNPQLPDGRAATVGERVKDVVNALLYPFSVSPAVAAPGGSRVGMSVSDAVAIYGGKVITTNATTYGFPGDKFNPDGALTSVGTPVSQTLYSAAHRDLPLGTVVKVTNPENGKSVAAVINNRGTLKDSALIDLTPGTARAIATNPGSDISALTTENARVEVLYFPSQGVASNYLNSDTERRLYSDLEGLTKEQSEAIVASTFAIQKLNFANKDGEVYIGGAAKIQTAQLPEFTPVQVAQAAKIQEVRATMSDAIQDLKTIDQKGVQAAKNSDLEEAVSAARQAQVKIEEITASANEVVKAGVLPAVEAQRVVDAAKKAEKASVEMVRTIEAFGEKSMFEKLAGQGVLKQEVAALKQELARSVETIAKDTTKALAQSPVGQTVAAPSIPTFVPAAIPDTNPLVSATFKPGAFTQIRAAQAYSAQSAKIAEYQNMSGAQLASFERSALLNVGAELEARGHRVEYALRSGSFRQSSGELPPQPLQGLIAHLPEGTQSAAYYVRTPLLKDGFYTAYSMGIDCSESVCTVTIALPAEGSTVALRDNHVSKETNRRPNPADGSLYSWNTLGIVIPGARGAYNRDLSPLEKKAALDVGQVTAKIFGFSKAFGHNEQDFKSALISTVPETGEGVKFASVLREGMNQAGVLEAAPTLVGSIREFARVITGGQAATTVPFGAVLAPAKLQLASVGEVQTGSLKGGVVTHAHWLNEGGVQSGEITPEIIKRLPGGAEISVPHTYGAEKIQSILNSCNGCKVKFYIESNPKETNDVAYNPGVTDNRAILDRIQKTAQVRDQLVQAGYGGRIVNSIELDAARDYFDKGDYATPILHAQWMKANGFEFYEPKSLLEGQIQQVINGSGLRVRSAVFEDPKKLEYLKGIVESIQSGRPTTVSFKEVATPGYVGDTKEEAVAFAKEYMGAGNLTVVYSPKGGIPEYIKFGQAGVSPLQTASLSSLPRPAADTSSVRIIMPSGESVQAIYRQGLESWNIGLEELKALTPEARKQVQQVQIVRADGSKIGYTSFVSELQRTAETARGKAALDVRRQSVFAQALGTAQSAVRYIGAQANAVVAQIAPGKYAVATRITPEQAAAEAALAAAKKQEVFSEQSFVRVENANVYIVDPAKPNERFLANTVIKNTMVSRGEPGRFATAQPIQTEVEMKAVASILNKILPDSLGYITQPIAVKNAAGETVIITPKRTAEVNALLRQNGMHELQPIYTNKTWGDRYSGQVSAGLRTTQEALLSQKARIEAGELSGSELAQFYRSIGLVGLQNTLRPDIVRAKVLAEKILGAEFYTIAATEDGHKTHLQGDHFDAYFGPIGQPLAEKNANRYESAAMNTKTAAAAAWVRAARETNLSGLPCVGTYGGAGMHFGSCSGTRGWDIGGNGGGTAITAYRRNPSEGVGGFSFEDIVAARNESYYAQTNRMTPQESTVYISRELTDIQRRSFVPIAPEEVFKFTLANDVPTHRIIQVAWGGTQTGNQSGGGTAPAPGGDNPAGGGVGGAGGGPVDDVVTGSLPSSGGSVPPSDAQILEALRNGTLPAGARVEGVILVGAAGAAGFAYLSGDEEKDLAAIKEELNKTDGPLVVNSNTLEVYVQKKSNNPAAATGVGGGSETKTSGSAFMDSLRKIMSGANSPATQAPPLSPSGAGSAPSGSPGGGGSAPSAPSGSAGGTDGAGTIGGTEQTPGTPTITSFSCSPTSVLRIGTTTINWSCANTVTAEGVNFNTNGVAAGTAVVVTATTTTYTLQCGAATQSCAVSSLHPKAVVVANPSRIPRGGSTNIGWVASETESCSLYGSLGIISAGGRTGVVPVDGVSASTRYVLVCATKAGVPFSKEIDVFIDNEQVISQGAQVVEGTMVGQSSAYSFIGSTDAASSIGSNPVQPASSGTFTATDDQGNVVNLCDPAVGIDRFTRCLMGE